MSKTILCFSIITLALAMGCSQKEEANYQEVVEAYFEALNRSDFEALQSVLADSVIFGEGEYITRYSLAEYYRWWQWDSIFQP
ncbi:MAG: nuclear transport factor 2 family protein, partial [Bacteroidota bacterium]